MTMFKFEGDIENLNVSQRNVVDSALQKKGFNDGTVKVEPVGEKGDNYAAHVKRFICETSDGSTFKMIGKIAPTAEQARLMMNTALIFNNEIIMYTKIFPKMNTLQNQVGINESEKIRFPECYGVLSEAPFEFILLEDLTVSGFEMLDRFKPLTDECVRLVLKDLAIFHSLSYALKNAEPEIYKNATDSMTNMWVLMHGDPNAKQFFENVENNVKSLMGSEMYKRVVNGTLSQISEHCKKLESYEKTSKFSLIQQGDCWNNNILFRLEDGKPVENVIIDYQLARESNPAGDILYMIFNCTDHASRLKYFQEWIDHYHESLDDSLVNHGLKANFVYPRDQLDADLRRYGKYIVGASIMLSSIIVQESKNAVDFNDMTGAEGAVEEALDKIQVTSMNQTTAAKLKERVEGIVDTVIEFGLV